MRKMILLILLPYLAFGGSECKITYKMMYSIAVQERHKHKPVGYPYLISFNNKKDSSRLSSKDKKKMLDNRTLDCKSRSECTQIAQALIKKGVTNMDMGPFQICYKYHGKKIKVNDFFSLKDSFAYAKKFVTQNVKRHGCTWKSLARYHSATKKHNTRYAKGLINAYYSN